MWLFDVKREEDYDLEMWFLLKILFFSLFIFVGFCWILICERWGVFHAWNRRRKRILMAGASRLRRGKSGPWPLPGSIEWALVSWNSVLIWIEFVVLWSLNLILAYSLLIIIVNFYCMDVLVLNGEICICLIAWSTVILMSWIWFWVWCVIKFNAGTELWLLVLHFAFEELIFFLLQINWTFIISLLVCLPCLGSDLKFCNSWFMLNCDSWDALWFWLDCFSDCCVQFKSSAFLASVLLEFLDKVDLGELFFGYIWRKS